MTNDNCRSGPRAVRVPWLLSFLLLAAISLIAPSPAAAVDDAYRPPSDAMAGGGGQDAYSPSAPPSDTYRPYRPLDGSERPPEPGGYGEPYTPTPQGRASRDEYYEPVPPTGGGGPPDDGGSRGYFTQEEIVRAGHGFFGKVSSGLASAIEWTFQSQGRPNGYILGQDAGGALVAGLRYGEGTLYTKDAGNHRVYWQGPTIGYDAGAEGSKVMTLVYNLRDPSDIYNRFGGVEGSAYVVGGVGVQIQKAGDVTLAPIRSGVGLRLGANVGYLKYTRNPTWNPF